jgi:hypothetical protein
MMTRVGVGASCGYQTRAVTLTAQKAADGRKSAQRHAMSIGTEIALQISNEVPT